MISFVNLKWDGAGSLEVVADNRAASVHGEVTDGGKPAAGAVVMIAPGPPPQGGYTSTVDFEQKSTHATGAFGFEGLAAGEYRLFAIPSDLAGRFGLGPEDVDQLAPRGARVAGSARRIGAVGFEVDHQVESTHEIQDHSQTVRGTFPSDCFVDPAARHRAIRNARIEFRSCLSEGGPGRTEWCQGRMPRN